MPGKLGELVDLVYTIGFGATASEPRGVLGQVYVYFLGMFASAEGKRGGQFYTPRSIVNTLVAILAPHHGKVYDPCCGSGGSGGCGGMFLQSEEFIEAHGGKIGDVAIFGQEANPTTWPLAAMNLAICGIDFNLGREPADTFTKNQFADLRADFILANPPFNISDWWHASLTGDARWVCGDPPQGNANYDGCGDSADRRHTRGLAWRGRCGRLRRRGGLPKTKAATVSLVTGATKEASLVKADESDSASTRYARQSLLTCKQSFKSSRRIKESFRSCPTHSSSYLKQHQGEYYRRLSAVRTDGDWEGWVGFFLDGVEAAASEAERGIVAVASLINADRRRLLAAPRVGAVALRLFEQLPLMPRFTIEQVRQKLDTTFPTATAAVKLLEELGIVTELTGQKKNRSFSYAAYVELLAGDA